MAFNPLHNFQKYKKIWMASVLLICMFSFVLCSGVGGAGQGDAGGWILALFRSKGTVLARVDGTNIYSEDLREMKAQRNVADKFMRKATASAIDNLAQYMNKEAFEKLIGELRMDPVKDRPQLVTLLTGFRQIFQERLKQPRYFTGGVTFQDLIDFKLWLKEADRLNIYLDDESVRKVYQTEFGVPISPELGYLPTVSPQEFLNFAADLRRDAQVTNFEDFLLQSLRNEFRARMAQLALMKAPVNISQKVRAVPTPAQLWDFYKDKRSTFDVTLIPVRAEDFMGKVPPPTPSELQAFFEKYKDTPSDPTSDQPGLQLPERVQIEMLWADPDSKHYKTLGKAMLGLQLAPPVVFDPVAPPWLTYLRLGMVPELETALAKIEADARARPFKQTIQAGNLANDLSTWWGSLAIWPAQRDPKAIATLVGTSLTETPLTGIAAFLFAGSRKHPEWFDRITQAEIEHRLPIYRTAAALLTTPQTGLAAAAVLTEEREIPPELYQDQLLRDAERSLSQEAGRRNMVQARKELSDREIWGRRSTMEEYVSSLVRRLGLTRVVTDYRTRFDIDDTKKLQPLKEAFDFYVNGINFAEGRSLTPERRLTPDDFRKLFFDKSESFSVAGSRYQPQAWPPDLRVKKSADRKKQAEAILMVGGLPGVPQEQLAMMEAPEPGAPESVISIFDRADNPILFWLADHQPNAGLDDLEKHRERVVTTWKRDKARSDLALPKAREIGMTLAGTGGEYDALVDAEAAKVPADRIVLKNVAPLYADDDPRDVLAGKPREYGEFKLAKGLIPFPRDDMSKQILALPKLDKALTIDNGGPIDRLNKELFETAKNAAKAKGNPNVRAIQVLTNQPKTNFYVAVITQDPSADRLDFDRAYRRAPQMRFLPSTDPLLDQAQERSGQVYREDLLLQFRKQYGVKIENEKEAQSFDN